MRRPNDWPAAGQPGTLEMAADPVPPHHPHVTRVTEPDPGPRYQDPLPPRPRFIPRPQPAPRPDAGPQPAAGPQPEARPQPRFIPHPPQPAPWRPPSPSAAGPSSLPASVQPTAPAQPERVQLTPAQPAPPQTVRGRPAPDRHRRLVPAIIGDELRIPILWCDFGSCVERYTHSDALGERDLRHRALTAGWRYDLLGRLACPSCVQHDATFWVVRTPAPARPY